MSKANQKKREDQRQRKLDKQNYAEKNKRNKGLAFKFALYGVLPLLGAITLFTLYSQGPTYSTVEIAPNDHVRGETESPVTLVVYADFQCPACATEHQAMMRIWPQVSSNAHLIFRHFPITAAHPNSWTASLYAEAAAKQDRFWEMHDYLFQTQAIWSNLQNVEEEFDSYALELNLDIEQLHLDIALPETISKIRNDQRGGNSAGVLSTPSLFINGKLLNRPDATRIRDAVKEAASLSG